MDTENVKKLRDRAERDIKQTLIELQERTGMTVSYVCVDEVETDDGRRVIADVRIDLELARGD